MDVKFDPEDDIIINDRDELDAAYSSGGLPAEQYLTAIEEGDAIVS